MKNPESSPYNSLHPILQAIAQNAQNARQSSVPSSNLSTPKFQAPDRPLPNGIDSQIPQAESADGLSTLQQQLQTYTGDRPADLATGGQHHRLLALSAPGQPLRHRRSRLLGRLNLTQINLKSRHLPAHHIRHNPKATLIRSTRPMPNNLAFILMSSQSPLTPGLFQQELAQQWPQLKVQNMSTQGTSLSFRADSAEITLDYIPAPYPWQTLEEPCEASLLWPLAADCLRPHQGHWQVKIAATTETLTPITRAKLLTQVTASVMACLPNAVGVYWAAGNLVVPKQLFIDFAHQFLPHELPIFIWVDVRVGPDSPTTNAAYTVGLDALGHLELETEGATDSIGDLRERLISIALYLLAKGPVISHGDTLGQTLKERIRVVVADSVFEHRQPVMRLQYESLVGARN
jgi:Domain of unknown function (DUF4261)